MVGKHKWHAQHQPKRDFMLITLPHPDVILNQFINVPIIDGWNAQMTLCSLHPPSHIESSYWWLDQFTRTQKPYWISLSTFL